MCVNGRGTATLALLRPRIRRDRWGGEAAVEGGGRLVGA